jgi:N-acetylglucosaminyl-diphospho-decaprenol L-rhamnosyltransferase
MGAAAEEKGVGNLKAIVGVTTFANSSMQLQRFARSFELACAEAPAGSLIDAVCVDNSGEAGLSAFVPTATSFRSDVNTGFAAATNRLMRCAFEEHGADVFVTANPDGAFHHQALGRLLEFHRRFPTSLVEAIQFPEEHPKIYDPVSFETPWCSACCLLIPRTVYEAIGPLDTSFFMYMEDVDYSWRARVAGLSSRVCPNALFAHDFLGRSPDPVVDRRLLASARYLAWKWRDGTAQRDFEVALRRQGLVRSSAELPALPTEDRRVAKADAERVADFRDRHFAFAPCRW